MSRKYYDSSTGEIQLIDIIDALRPVHMGRPEKRLRIESKTFKFDTNNSTTESHVIDFGT